MGDIERIVETRNGSTRARALIERVERTALEHTCYLRRPLPFLRDDINHAPQRVRSVETALRSAQHFHPRDIRGQHLSKIENTVLAGIVGLDSIDQYLGVIRIA